MSHLIFFRCTTFCRNTACYLFVICNNFFIHNIKDSLGRYPLGEPECRKMTHMHMKLIHHILYLLKKQIVILTNTPYRTKFWMLSSFILSFLPHILYNNKWMFTVQTWVFFNGLRIAWFRLESIIVGLPVIKINTKTNQ